MSENKYFGKALSNFIQDFASGGAVRHLADLGMTVTEIVEQLSYPISKTAVSDMVWKHYLSTGKISLKKPTQSGEQTRVTYRKEQTSYGRISMRRVVETVPSQGREYQLCDFGKQLYQDKTAFLSKLEALSSKDRQYILDLPWPLTPVYHECDERMQRIVRILEMAPTK